MHVRKSVPVLALDRIDECVETLPRRRIEMQSKANRSHSFRAFWLLAFSPLVLVEPLDEPARFDLPRNLVRDELFRIGVLRRGHRA